MNRIATEGFKHILKSPLLWNTLISIGLRGLGDVIQQNIERSSLVGDCKIDDQYKGHDWIRTRNVSASGIIIGPLNYYWYRYLDKILPKKTFSSISTKIVYDQIFGATVFTFLFIFIVSLLDGFTLKESFDEFVRKFPIIYLVDWLIWPPSQAVNFYFVSPKYRVVFVNFVILIWNTFLSFAKYNL